MSDKAWLQEYECEFLGTGDTFIDRRTLGMLKDSTSEDWVSDILTACACGKSLNHFTTI